MHRLRITLLAVVLVGASAVQSLLMAPALAQPKFLQERPEEKTAPKPDPDKEFFQVPAPAKNYDEACQVTVQLDPPQAQPGQTVTLRIQMKLKRGWQTYPTEQLDPNAADYVTRFRLLDTGPLQPVGGLVGPPPTLHKSDLSKNILALLYYQDAVAWEQKLRVPDDAKPGEYRVSALMLSKVCRDDCFAKDVGVAAKLVVVPKNALTVDLPIAQLGPQYAKSVRGMGIVVEPAKAMPGGKITVRLELQLANGWHTYPLRQQSPKYRTADSLSVLELAAPPGFTPDGEWSHKHLVDEGGTHPGRQILRGVATFERGFLVDAKASGGPVKFSGKFRFQTCTDESPGASSICLPPREVPLQFTVDVTGEAATSQEESLSVVGPGADSAGFWAFIVQAVVFGLISLITPCVFPMIPITVSFFLKQSERQGFRPLEMATVYSGTIVVVLTIGAALLLTLFQQAIQHWTTNMLLGAVFVYFALSLFGMYEIRLPAFIARYTSAQEAKGGVVGTIFMALTFTIISFSCVAPFLGGFAGLTASAASGFDWFKIICGALAFAVTFAAPFFLLALFPPLLRMIPKSGSWMNTVKVVMGFLEIAAALKFLRAGELLVAGEAHLLTFEFVLGLYVAISVACGLYLLGLFRLPHDDPEPSIGVPRFLFSLAFLGLALYLTPALFARGEDQRQRPKGVIYSWLESFLLPDGKGGIGNVFEGMNLARKENKRLFLNFTGET